MKFKVILASSLLAILCSCTIAPHPVVGTARVGDAEGGVNGFMGFRTDGCIRYGILDDSGRDRYNILISLYAVQFKSAYGVKLSTDAGIHPWHGLWLIDKEHLTYFTWLCQWSRDRQSPDSLLDKGQSAVGLK